jgi:NAD(P)-dependent dehydrogenase (short-subunit alcohol dehydrogenase family)
MNEIFSIRNKTAIVTGGARGIGRMIAEGFTKAGAKVYITARDEKKCAEAANQMSGFGTCLPLAVDLSDPGNIKTMSGQFARQENKLDILVNNAGKSWGAPLESFPDKAWNSVMSVNVQAPFTLVRDLLPLLKKQASVDNQSRVIHIGSVAG